MAEWMEKHGNKKWMNIWVRLNKNKMAMVSLGVLIIFILLALLAPVIAPQGYDDQNLADAFAYPCREHFLGTDNFGRDIFVRIIYGARIFLQIGLIAVGLACVAGGIIGAVSAYYTKWDNLIMRIMDVFMAIPNLLLSIAIATALGSGMKNLMIAVGITSIPQYARIMRASVMTIKEQEYIEAARANGAGDIRILACHIIPNAFAPILVQATLGVANAIISAATLSFMGLGIQPPQPEWGSMLSTGRTYLQSFWPMSVFPGLAIMLVVYALNILGDGLRDALDPRLKN